MTTPYQFYRCRLCGALERSTDAAALHAAVVHDAEVSRILRGPLADGESVLSSLYTLVTQETESKGAGSWQKHR